MMRGDIKSQKLFILIVTLLLILQVMTCIGAADDSDSSNSSDGTNDSSSNNSGSNDTNSSDSNTGDDPLGGDGDTSEDNPNNQESGDGNLNNDSSSGTNPNDDPASDVSNSNTGSGSSNSGSSGSSSNSPNTNGGSDDSTSTQESLSNYNPNAVIFDSKVITYALSLAMMQSSEDQLDIDSTIDGASKTIVITVTEDGKPVSNVAVAFLGNTYLTGDGGTVELSAPNIVGSFLLTASKSGSQSNSQWITVGALSNQNEDMNDGSSSASNHPFIIKWLELIRAPIPLRDRFVALYD